MSFTNHHGRSHSPLPMPGSPPDLTGSKSSKSSSFHSSYQSDDNTILSDVGNFEDIGLDDEARTDSEIGDFAVKTSIINPYDNSFAADLRTTARQRKRVPMAATHGNRVQRELINQKAKSPYAGLRGPVRSVTDGLGLLPIVEGNTMARRLTNPSTSSLSSLMKRNRSASPNMPRSNLNYNRSSGSLKVRRGSWQANKERKTAKELEQECDEEDGDDIPDEVFLENVPISPRPPQERSVSMPASASTSPERAPREKIRSVGNGTSPRPAEQGELRSPRPRVTSGESVSPFPLSHDTLLKSRAKSWTAALSELSPEAKALTEALEEYAGDEGRKDHLQQRRSLNTTSTSRPHNVDKPRVKSAIAELPPLRRTDIMIDPLPISKEKEAVLSRTRPSWLPPKNPAEEKRHLKEYQKMMASSMEAERKKEAEREARSTCRDDTASSLLRIWEEHVLPNWTHVVHHKRTRELWWRGIAPRSRGAVWERAIGNELGLTESSYTAALRRAQALETTIKRGSQLTGDEEKKRGWLERIEADVQETYPELKIFQKGGPLNEGLKDVLYAYAMYRSDVGYVHGTSTIAALLLLNLPTAASTFISLSNILNRPLPLSFHTNDPGAISRSYTLLLETLQHKSPRLHAHLTSPELALTEDMYLRDLMAGMFTGDLSLDNATRLWDVVVFEGDKVLVRAGVAFLIQLEGKLFGAKTRGEICGIVKEGVGELGEEEWMSGVRDAGKG